MKKLEQLYEGKAKKVFATDDPNVVLVDYKDDATAFNGLKKGTIQGKGVINNRVTNFLMKMLEKNGIPTHFVEEISDRETLVKKVTIVPLEVIVRNIAAGSLSQAPGPARGHQARRRRFWSIATRMTSWATPWSTTITSAAMELAAQRGRPEDTLPSTACEVNELLTRLSEGSEHRAGRLQAGVRQDWLTAPSCWRMRFPRTPAASGTA